MIYVLRVDCAVAAAASAAAVFGPAGATRVAALAHSSRGEA